MHHANVAEGADQGRAGCRVGPRLPNIQNAIVVQVPAGVDWRHACLVVGDHNAGHPYVACIAHNVGPSHRGTQLEGLAVRTVGHCTDGQTCTEWMELDGKYMMGTVMRDEESKSCTCTSIQQ